MGARCVTGPAFEGPVKSTSLGEPQQEGNLAHGKLWLPQVACRGFAAHLRQDAAETCAFFVEPAVQSAGTHAQSRRDLFKCRRTIRELLGKQPPDRIGGRFGFGQLCKESHNLSLDNALKDRVRLEKRQIQKLAGEDQLAAAVPEFQWTTEHAMVFRRIRWGTMGEARPDRNPIYSGRLSRRYQPAGQYELGNGAWRAARNWQPMTKNRVVTMGLKLHPGGVVQEPMIAGKTRESRTLACARPQRIVECPKSARPNRFRNVETQVGIVRVLNGRLPQTNCRDVQQARFGITKDFGIHSLFP